MNEDELNLLLNASPMHDIGKIGISDSMLLKASPLEPEEWEIMKKHAQIGANILSGDDSPMMKMAREIALTHHEKWDGSGYPNGLKGEGIPLVGIISALAHVFDALMSSRPYKKNWNIEETIEFIKNNSGIHFDPQLVEYFIKHIDDIIEIRNKYSDS